MIWENGAMGSLSTGLVVEWQVYGGMDELGASWEALTTQQQKRVTELHSSW